MYEPDFDDEAEEETALDALGQASLSKPKDPACLDELDSEARSSRKAQLSISIPEDLRQVSFLSQQSTLSQVPLIHAKNLPASV